MDWNVGLKRQEEPLKSVSMFKAGWAKGMGEPIAKYYRIRLHVTR